VQGINLLQGLGLIQDFAGFENFQRQATRFDLVMQKLIEYQFWQLRVEQQVRVDVDRHIGFETRAFPCLQLRQRLLQDRFKQLMARGFIQSRGRKTPGACSVSPSRRRASASTRTTLARCTSMIG
jgi:hypothetical protein